MQHLLHIFSGFSVVLVLVVSLVMVSFTAGIFCAKIIVVNDRKSISKCFFIIRCQGLDLLDTSDLRVFDFGVQK